MIYDCTSRTGDLMKMKVILPIIHEKEGISIIKTISDTTHLPNDCAFIISQFIGMVSWCNNIENIGIIKLNNNELNKRNDVICYSNKLPTWNSHLSAYTLEFGGRAKMPSVHNFQLSNGNSDNVILQLGKVSKTEFNMDYSYPLTPIQAFAICISVIDRSFVWD